jgi:hypothetical protein
MAESKSGGILSADFGPTHAWPLLVFSPLAQPFLLGGKGPGMTLLALLPVSLLPLTLPVLLVVPLLARVVLMTVSGLFVLVVPPFDWATPVVFVVMLMTLDGAADDCVGADGSLVGVRDAEITFVLGGLVIGGGVAIAAVGIDVLATGGSGLAVTTLDIGELLICCGWNDGVMDMPISLVAAGKSWRDGDGEAPTLLVSDGANVGGDFWTDDGEGVATIAVRNIDGCTEGKGVGPTIVVVGGLETGGVSRFIVIDGDGVTPLLTTGELDSEFDSWTAPLVRPQAQGPHWLGSSTPPTW